MNSTALASRDRTTRHRRRVAAVAVGLGLVLGACGGAAEEPTGQDTGADTGATDAPATQAPAPDPTSTDAAGDECAPDTMPLHEPGVLTAATGDPVFEPWMVDNDPTNGQGYESAVVYALAEQLGFTADQVTWTSTGFDEAITPGDKAWDFNIQQYTITEQRDEVVDFTAPYYVADRAVIAITGSPADGATTIADLEAATWGATTGTVDLDYIENEMGFDDVAVYNTQADTFAAMAAGQIDATVINLPSAYFEVAVNLEDAVIAGVLPEGGGDTDELGLLLEEGSELKSCLDQAMEALRDAGTLDDLANEWLTGDGDIPTIER